MWRQYWWWWISEELIIRKETTLLWLLFHSFCQERLGWDWQNFQNRIMAFSLPSETSVKHIKFLRGIFHSSNKQVLAFLFIIYLNFYLPGSLSRYRSHLLQWQPSLQQSIIDEKITKLSNNVYMQHNQFISTFQLLVGLLFPEIKNSLGEIVYQQTTCPLILQWKIEVSWILPCHAAISDLWQSLEYQLSLSTSLLLPHHTVEELYEQVVSKQ